MPTDELEVYQNPYNTDAIDLLMWVGEAHYTVATYVREAMMWGVSKRISANAIPEGVVNGVSRLFLAHRKAIVAVGPDSSFLSFVSDIMGARYAYMTSTTEEWSPSLPLSLAPYDIVPENMLQLLMAFQDVPLPEQAALTKKYELTWHPGVFGYTYITGLQYVCKDGEDDLPEDKRYLDGYIEPVRIRYTGNTCTDDDAEEEIL